MPVVDRYDLGSIERLEGFIQSYESYKKSKLLDELGNEATFQILSEASQANELKVRLGWAVSLRKYVLGKKDPYYLLKVHVCLEDLGLVFLDEDSRTHLGVLLHQLEVGQVGPVAIHESADGRPTPDSQIVDDALNGFLLHSDPDKMKRHLARPEMSVHLSTYSWVLQAERLCDLAYKMALETIATST